MKKKIIIVITVVVVLALGGTLAFAAVDEDGNWVNPFTNILAEKIEEGAITQNDADTFSKVWEEIKGEMGRPGDKMTDRTLPDKESKMAGWERPDMNSEFMTELKQVMTDKTSEILDKLVADGIIPAEDVEKAGDKGLNLMMYMKYADEDTVAAIKEAMTDLKDDISAYLEEKVADGTITQEQSDMFSKVGMAGQKITGGMTKDGDFNRRMTGRSKTAGKTDEDTGE